LFLTPVFTEPIQLTLRVSEELRGSEYKNDVNNNQSLLATLTKNSFSSKKKLQPLSESVRVSASIEKEENRRASLLTLVQSFI
jgi:hypothetical protein